MASNKDLIAQAVALALVLKIEIKTDGLNNKKLSDLVSDLKAKTKDAELDTQADGPTVVAEAEEREPGVYVAEGKAITSKVGIREAGSLVTEGHLAGGAKALEALVEYGVCVEVK